MMSTSFCSAKVRCPRPLGCMRRQKASKGPMATSFAPRLPRKIQSAGDAMKAILVAVVCLSVPVAAGHSGEWIYGEGAQYIQRSDTITLGAGNAKDVNAATHVIDPWPRD